MPTEATIAERLSPSTVKLAAQDSFCMAPADAPTYIPEGGKVYVALVGILERERKTFHHVDTASDMWQALCRRVCQKNHDSRSRSV